MSKSIKVDSITFFDPQTGQFGTLPQIQQFTSDTNTIVRGNSVTISWSVTNATVVKLNNEPVEFTGSKKFWPCSVSAFALFAENNFGEARSETLSVQILEQETRFVSGAGNVTPGNNSKNNNYGVIFFLGVSVLILLGVVISQQRVRISATGNNDSIDSVICQGKQPNESLKDQMPETPLDSYNVKEEFAYNLSEAQIRDLVDEYFLVLNSSNVDLLHQKLSPTVEKYFKLRHTNPEGVIAEIRRYTSDVVSDATSFYDSNSLRILKTDGYYVIDFSIKESSVLRKNQIPYLYEVEQELKIDDNGQIFFIDGKVLRKSVDTIKLFGGSIENGNLMLTESNFSKIFSDLNNSALDDDWRYSLKKELLDTDYSSVVVVNQITRVWSLEEYCQDLVQQKTKFNFVSSSYSSQGQIYRILVNSK